MLFIIFDVISIYFGPNGGGHADMRTQGPKPSYPGRIWTESKIIAFWVYPNNELFKSIIEKLEDELNLKIFNNGWRIEIQITNGKIKKREVSTNNDYYINDEGYENANDYYINDEGYENAKLVPIEDYIGSEDVDPNKRELHLMNWKEKEKLKQKGKLARGFGSDTTAWDSKKPIEWRQAMLKSENYN
jgi:hypothetical protein